MRSRSASRPAWYGEALRLTIELGPAGGLVGDGPVGRPGVLADGDADPYPADDEQLTALGPGAK